MSLLLSGPNSITEWIEKAAFHAIVKGPESVEYRPKLVQVLSRGGRGFCNSSDSECPCYLMIHDGQTSTAAFLSDKKATISKQEATKGSVVRISGWSVSTVQHCAGDHYQELTQAPPNVTSRAALERLLNTPICLSVDKVETIGGQGMGLVGNPEDVNESIDVKRALQSINYNHEILLKRLKLKSVESNNVLGDVMMLMTGDKFDAALEMGKEQGQKDASHVQQQQAPVGDVMEFMGTYPADNDTPIDPFDALLTMGQQERRAELLQKQATPPDCTTDDPVDKIMLAKDKRRESSMVNHQQNVVEPIELEKNAEPIAVEQVSPRRSRGPRKSLESLFALAHQQQQDAIKSQAQAQHGKEEEEENTKESSTTTTTATATSESASVTPSVQGDVNNNIGPKRTRPFQDDSAVSRESSQNEEPFAVVNMNPLFQPAASKTLESLFALADRQRRQENSEDKAVAKSQPDDNDGESQEEDGIVGISDMLVSQQEEGDEEVLQDAQNLTGSDKRQKRREYTAANMEPASVTAEKDSSLDEENFVMNAEYGSRPLKRHKANSFFENLMKGAREGYTGVISLGGKVSETRQAIVDGSCIRTWLDSHVRR